jgi:sulfate permease, SulP family
VPQHPFRPKSIVCFREGYDRRRILADVLAGVTVGFIAFPLAMALAIASGVEPERGLYTAVIAGFLIAALGGSRVQIGGPTGAFVVIVLGIVDRHGEAGLALATIMAGLILVVLGLARFGSVIKFVPYPVTTGFTTGIALLIFSQQIKDLFGLELAKTSSEFVERWIAYVRAADTYEPITAAIGIASLVLLFGLQRLAPKVPGAIVTLALATALVAWLDLDERFGVATIGSRFGGIPRSLPMPSLPAFDLATLEQARALVPEATTIALLAAIESLLCAVVADGMIGGRHKSNMELVGQGVANVASVVFGGIPATGAIARTAANVKAGGRTPLAGMVHAVTILLLMFAVAPLASRAPLAALAAVLVVVAWNMAEIDHFRSLLRAPKSDVAVLLTTFWLTVFTDLTVAVGVGMVLASLLFMRRMSEVTNVGAITRELDEPDDAEVDFGSIDRRDVPPAVEVYEINGPFFFGVADRLKDVLRRVERSPKVFILRMRHVPAVDASGMHALEEFLDKCRREGIHLLLAGVHTQPLDALLAYGLFDRIGEENMLENIDDALDRARELLKVEPAARPADRVPEVARERERDR